MATCSSGISFHKCKKRSSDLYNSESFFAKKEMADKENSSRGMSSNFSEAAIFK